MKNRNSGLILALSMALAGSPLVAQVPYQTDEATLFLYHFDEDADASVASDASGQQRDLSYGEQTGRGKPSLSGLGSSYSPDGKQSVTLWSESSGRESTGLLYQLAKSSFTIELWVKFDHLNFPGNVPLLTIQSVNAFPAKTDQLRLFDYTLDIISPENPHAGGALSLGGRNLLDQVHSGPLEWEVGQWYHVAVTYEPDEDGMGVYRFYRAIPGDAPSSRMVKEETVLELSGWDDDVDRGAERRLLIGYYPGVSEGNILSGYIDEIRISNTVRKTFDTLELSKQ